MLGIEYTINMVLILHYHRLAYYDQWVSLSTYAFVSDSSTYVRLTDATGGTICGIHIGFDVLHGYQSDTLLNYEAFIYIYSDCRYFISHDIFCHFMALSYSLIPELNNMKVRRGGVAAYALKQTDLLLSEFS